MSTPVFQRKQEDISDGLCPEGAHEATIASTELEESSRSGRPMMVTEFVVDRGEAQGERVVHRFVFETASSFGERQLRDMSDLAGYTWEQGHSYEEFVEQFEGLRVGIKVTHRYSYKSNGDYEEVDLETWEQIDEAKHEKYRNAEISSFFEPKGDPEIDVGDSSSTTDDEDEAPF